MRHMIFDLLNNFVLQGLSVCVTDIALAVFGHAVAFMNKNLLAPRIRDFTTLFPRRNGKVLSQRERIEDSQRELEKTRIGGLLIKKIFGTVFYFTLKIVLGG